MFFFLVSYQRLGLSVDWRYLKPVNFFHHFGESVTKTIRQIGCVMAYVN